MPKKPVKKTLRLASDLIEAHFQQQPIEQLVTATRTYAAPTRVDLNNALLEWHKGFPDTQHFGIHKQYTHSTLSFSDLFQTEHDPVLIAPLQFEEVDIGETMAARCLKKAMWLSVIDDVPVCALISEAERYGRATGYHLEIAVAPGVAGVEVTRRFFAFIEENVNQAASYRGKVLSMEASNSYTGEVGSVRVHKLRNVVREEVILPEKTLQLLERNVHEFIRARERLRGLRMQTKKGLLFYGPPGTGKTHTIHYLAGQLPDHTTLLITAGQVGLLDEYFQLARFLQPALVVIEDVDLIARARESMRGPCEESILNNLLNEMDGLKEDCDSIFVLTTNRPEQLEAALASRPGRIDQSIEFPLPDLSGRKKLIKLYARDLDISDEMINTVANRIENASAAFIKELMRRAAQNCLQHGGSNAVTKADIDIALEEMLFTGGSLNVKLLGGAAPRQSR